MVTEQDKTLEALQIAIEIEKDGNECYLKASEESGNEVGKKLLESLAAEEDTHRQKFEQIYQAIRDRKGWPKTAFRPDKGKKLRALFAKTCEVVGVDVKGHTTEFDAIKTAMDKENKSYDFYNRQSKNATYEGASISRWWLSKKENNHFQHSLILTLRTPESDYRKL